MFAKHRHRFEIVIACSFLLLYRFDRGSLTPCDAALLLGVSTDFVQQVLLWQTLLRKLMVMMVVVFALAVVKR